MCYRFFNSWLANTWSLKDIAQDITYQRVICHGAESTLGSSVPELAMQIYLCTNWIIGWIARNLTIGINMNVNPYLTTTVRKQISNTCISPNLELIETLSELILFSAPRDLMGVVCYQRYYAHHNRFFTLLSSPLIRYFIVMLAFIKMSNQLLRYTFSIWYQNSELSRYWRTLLPDINTAWNIVVLPHLCARLSGLDWYNLICSAKAYYAKRSRFFLIKRNLGIFCNKLARIDLIATASGNKSYVWSMAMPRCSLDTLSTHYIHVIM